MTGFYLKCSLNWLNRWTNFNNNAFKIMDSLALIIKSKLKIAKWEEEKNFLLTRLRSDDKNVKTNRIGSKWSTHNLAFLVHSNYVISSPTLNAAIKIRKREKNTQTQSENRFRSTDANEKRSIGDNIVNLNHRESLNLIVQLYPADC